MNNDTQQVQTAEQKLLKLDEGMVPPRVVIPDEQKGMVPVTFIPPTIQQTAQTAQTNAGQPSQQTISTQQSTTTQQTQSSGQSQSSEHK